MRFYHVCNLIITINSASNFIIYCLFRRQFQRQLRQLMSRRNRFSSSEATSSSGHARLRGRSATSLVTSRCDAPCDVTSATPLVTSRCHAPVWRHKFHAPRDVTSPSCIDIFVITSYHFWAAILLDATPRNKGFLGCAVQTYFAESCLLKFSRCQFSYFCRRQNAPIDVPQISRTPVQKGATPLPPQTNSHHAAWMPLFQAISVFRSFIVNRFFF